jgi:pimeloyl-ACP methyl ester carboxylesterase
MGISTTRTRINTAPGIEIDVTSAGDPTRPTVMLCHGFPESGHSWRHQIEPLVTAGFHVIVPDQRGYASSSAPRDPLAYGAEQLTGDLVAILDAFGVDQAVMVGHDWGAILVWHMAELHPERTRAVIAASVPYTKWPMTPTELFRSVYGDRFFYMLYFQEVGPAETELDADVRRTMHTVMWAASGEKYMAGGEVEMPALGQIGWVDSMVLSAGSIPDHLPDWLTEEDFEVYVRQFTESGFFGPVSWYRNLDANYALTSNITPDELTMPTFFIGGTHDAVTAGRPGYIESMERALPNHRGTVIIDGAGHWLQQEAPAEFNSALLGCVNQIFSEPV